MKRFSLQALFGVLLFGAGATAGLYLNSTVAFAHPPEECAACAVCEVCAVCPPPPPAPLPVPALDPNSAAQQAAIQKAIEAIQAAEAPVPAAGPMGPKE